ncbi:MAG TPA: tetratricopeptide repeat protein [Abditibacteriaceae bacterium]|jgi:tetratricopeptide (TPR) repeat protein
MVCGRCGHHTALNSTYCPHDRWTLFIDIPDGNQRAGAAIAGLESPRGVGGLLERRRLEKQRSHLERDIRHAIDARVAALEKRLQIDPRDFEAQRAMGVLAMLEHHWERANAHLHLAHELNPNDFETHINYAITMAQRGQLQPSLDLLAKARTTWPDSPPVLFNQALVGLQARRASIVLEAIEQLEKLWQNNATLAQDFHDEAMTLRGLAYLLENKPNEARTALELAARHSPAAAAALTATPRFNLEAPPGTDRRAVERRVSNAPRDVNVVPVERRMAERRLLGESGLDGEQAEDEITQFDPDSPEVDHPQMDEAEIVQMTGKTADADLLNNLGIAEAAAGDFDRAVGRLAAAMRLEPGNAKVHNNLGVLAYGQGQLAAAYKHLEIARQIEDFLEQPDPITFNHLGVVLSAMGRNEEGMQEFQKAGGHERAEFEVWYNLGRAYIEHGKPDKGVEYLRRAFQANPNHADVHIVLGAAYLLRGQQNLLPEALKHLKRALQINPRHRIAFANLAMALMEMEQPEQALRVVSEALKVHPKSAESLFLMALLMLKSSGETDNEQVIARAASLFNKAFDARPDLLVCLYNMALCQYVVGFRDAAAQQLDIVVKRDPSLAPAYYLIGVGHADGRRFPEALAAWQIAAKYEPGNPDLQASMGYIYYQREDWTNAISCYMKAHNAAPSQPDFLSALGLCFARAGMIPKAIQSFEQSLKLRPHEPVTHSNLGLAYYFQKQVERAVEQWRIVSQLDASYAASREEDQYRNYDDSLVSMRPLNWRARIIKMAPVLPRPHTHLVPGYNARAFRVAVTDPALQKVQKLTDDLEHAMRLIGWVNAKK